MVRCKDCKHAKWNRRLNIRQQLLFDLSKILSPDHEPSRQKRIEMQMEIVAEFCKLGHVNLHGDCKHYERKWWKFWR